MTTVAFESAGPLSTTTPATLVAAAELDVPIPEVPVHPEKRTATIIEKTASVAFLLHFFIITYLIFGRTPSSSLLAMVREIQQQRTKCHERVRW
jgi:hypothetical protein